MNLQDTICALSTPQGMGAIAVIRLSGAESISILAGIFKPYGKKHKVEQAKGYTMLFGKIQNHQHTLDEVMVGVYRAPQSYTSQDVVEINCHGSVYIQEQIIRLLLQKGARLADPGEFTLRAYLNGKMDLSQAEGVADLIASESEAAHQVALQQMRGGFSNEIKGLREELIQFASLIELELDFGEEDVEFANRKDLQQLLERISGLVQHLLKSYDTGNVIKNGVPVSIVGAPNAGKSTLLNALLHEERAIVTEVAGTTRDAIEDVLMLGGIKFRFIDTAGIRETTDQVESMGIAKTFEKIAQSRAVLYLFDAANGTQNPALIEEEISTLQEKCSGKHLFILANKTDVTPLETLAAALRNQEHFYGISALRQMGIEALTDGLLEALNLSAIDTNQTIVTNARHFHALQASRQDIERVREGLALNRSGDLLAFDIRAALQNLGSIIGEVDVDQDILGNIFGKFCIGK